MIKIENGKIEFNETLVLENINLEIIDNESYLLLGKNAAGKTCLCDVIIGFEKLYSGSFSTTFNKKEILMISNVLPFYDDEKVKNILLIYRRLFGFKKEDINDFMETFELTIYNDYEVKELSSGTIQKLLLIPFFLGEFKLIVLDEVFKNLDSVSQKKLFEEIIIRKNKATLLVVEHNDNIISEFRKQDFKEMLCKEKTLIKK